MAEPINLNRYRKAKARAESKARADNNAVKFGRRKSEKTLDKARSDKAQHDLDGHEKEP